MSETPMVGVGMPAALHLDAFGREIDAAFGHIPYLVGTAALADWLDDTASQLDAMPFPVTHATALAVARAVLGTPDRQP